MTGTPVVETPASPYAWLAAMPRKGLSSVGQRGSIPAQATYIRNTPTDLGVSTVANKLIDNPKNRSAIAVYDSMPKNVDPLGNATDRWTTADDIVNATSLSKSTVNAMLRKLSAEDLAEAYVPETKGAVKLWRGIEYDRAHDAEPAEEPAKPAKRGRGKANLRAVAESDSPSSRGPGVAEGTPRAPKAVKGGAVGAVAARMKAARPVADAPAEEGAPRKTGVCTRPECGLPIEKIGRSWEHVHADGQLRSDIDHKATTAKPRQAAAPRAPRADGTKRTLTIDPKWAGGGIKSAALAYLKTNKHRDFSVAEVSVAIGHTNTGAVGNALERLRNGDGSVALAQDKPRRYKAA